MVNFPTFFSPEVDRLNGWSVNKRHKKQCSIKTCDNDSWSGSERGYCYPHERTQQQIKEIEKL